MKVLAVVFNINRRKSFEISGLRIDRGQADVCKSVPDILKFTAAYVVVKVVV